MPNKGNTADRYAPADFFVDAEDFPELAQWVGEVLPISIARMSNYYNAVIAMHLAIAKAVLSSEYK